MPIQQHTPGPWICHSGMVYQEDTKSKNPFDSTLPIAVMDRVAGNGTYGAQRDANAELIAKAPELLELCKNFASWTARAVERWESGDLAEAVRNLDHQRQAFVKLMNVKGGE